MVDKINKSSSSSMKTFKCNKCSYTFSLKAKYSLRCPFCGSENLINFRDSNDAQELIDEVSNVPPEK